MFFRTMFLQFWCLKILKTLGFFPGKTEHHFFRHVLQLSTAGHGCLCCFLVRTNSRCSSWSIRLVSFGAPAPCNLRLWDFLESLNLDQYDNNMINGYQWLLLSENVNLEVSKGFPALPLVIHKSVLVTGVKTF